MPLCRDTSLHGLRLQEGPDGYIYEHVALPKLQAHLQQWRNNTSNAKTILEAYSPAVAFEFHQLVAGAFHDFLSYVPQRYVPNPSARLSRQRKRKKAGPALRTCTVRRCLRPSRQTYSSHPPSRYHWMDTHIPLKISISWQRHRSV